MALTPDRFHQASVTELLEAGANARVGLDQRWVRAIVERGAAAVDELVRFGMVEPSDDVPVSLEEDILAMLRHLRSPKALPFYVEMLRRDPFEMPDDLLAAFLDLGEPAVEPLLELYAELGDEQGGEVAFVLAALGVRHPMVKEILVRRLDLDPIDASIALALFRDPGTKPALEAKLAAVDPASPDNETLRRELAEAAEAVTLPKPEPFDEPFDLWSLYPAEAAPAMSDLPVATRLEFLDSSVAEYRLAAAESFQSAEHTPAIRTRLLAAARQDADVKVRAAAWRALGESIDEKPVRAALEARLNDDSAPLEERAGALVGLSADASEPVLRRMREFYDQPEVRAAALEAMWKSMDRRFSSYFPKHLDDADVEVARQAVWGIGFLGIQSEVSRLRKLFENADLREDALFAYALSVPGEVSRGRVKGLFRKVETDAGGLSENEEELVQVALDQRLMLHGLEPVFFPEEHDHPHGDDDSGHAQPHNHASPNGSARVGRNDPCPCGSGKKYKKCHGA
ncbi:MAG: SEC-C metal-binding domain-containing protein [Bryobacteraceae bacterium]|nr:SEC-C metal-binding domain-containing protein [Bryobacteraceae bacterium]